MMAQRLFCCRDQAGARKAVIWSSVGVLLSVMMITVGMGLYAYFEHQPLNADQAARVKERVDYIFPIFILKAMPVGVKGLLFAAIFAAATATSTLSAMGQTALMSFYVPFLKKTPDDRHLILMSRVFILIAGALLCGSAIVCNNIRQYPDILNLALAMAAYTYGPVLGIFLLALLPLKRDARGALWAVPCSLVFSFAITWQHNDVARLLAVAAVLALAVAGWLMLRKEPAKMGYVAAALALVLFVTLATPRTDALGPAWIKLAFPWLYPIGTFMTLGLGWALGRPRAPAPA
jgi:SSS family solute:Na+ symporter